MIIHDEKHREIAITMKDTGIVVEPDTIDAESKDDECAVTDGDGDADGDADGTEEESDGAKSEQGSRHWFRDNFFMITSNCIAFACGQNFEACPAYSIPRTGFPFEMNGSNKLHSS